jgi:hypothetical protein
MGTITTLIHTTRPCHHRAILTSTLLRCHHLHLIHPPTRPTRRHSTSLSSQPTDTYFHRRWRRGDLGLRRGLCPQLHISRPVHKMEWRSSAILGRHRFWREASGSIDRRARLFIVAIRQMGKTWVFMARKAHMSIRLLPIVDPVWGMECSGVISCLNTVCNCLGLMQIVVIFSCNNSRTSCSTMSC